MIGLSFVSWTALFITIPILYKHINMKKIIKYIWLIPVLIYASTLPYKFTGNGLPYLYDFFGSLGLNGELVMVGIGLQELLISVGLFTGFRKQAALGSILVMSGAISTHLYLQQFDIVFIEAIIVMITSIIIYRKS